MRSRYFKVLAAVLCASALSLLSTAQAELKAGEGLSSKIEAVQAQYKGVEPVSVRFTLTNTSDKPVSVLKWLTPLEGFNSDMFRVTVDNKPVPYIGRLVKRGAPLPEDYVTIEPSGSVSAVVNLAEAYAIYNAGQYSVELRTTLLHSGPSAPKELAPAALKAVPRSLQSNPVTFTVKEKRQRPETDSLTALLMKEEVAAKVPAFESCSSTQQSTLNTALGNAQNYTAGSLLALLGTSESKRPNATRYKTWFGTYDAARYNSVTGHYSKILDAFQNKQITFKCGSDLCSSNWYAFVYAGEPYRIYLCNVFWNAPETGTDSKMGTLVHETSHFNVVASTDDHVYGQSGCKNLALSDPAKAIDNADSHEYFVENTPSLSMGLKLTLGSIVLVLLLLAAYALVRKGRRVLS